MKTKALTLFFSIFIILPHISFKKKFIISDSSINILQIDSTDYYLKQSKNKDKTLQKRVKDLINALKTADNIQNLNTKAKKLSSIAYNFYELGDTIMFLTTNEKAEKLAYQVKDTFIIADTHWSYADFYNKKSIYEKSYYHYNIAYNHFKVINKTYETARMLYAMSYIKGRYNDYANSEILAIQALKKFKTLNNYRYIYETYNRLGILQHDIKEYDKAIEYYHKAISYYRKIPKEVQQKKYIEVYNNIANAYFQKKEYKTALEYYNKELSNKNLKREQYARILANYAYCKLFNNDTSSVKKDLYSALNIRDSLNNKAGIVINKIYLSNYYIYFQDTIKALQYAKQANSLAKEIKNGTDYLTTLQQLGNLDTKNSKQYLDRYIEFNDSLISEERRMQNKFTRIEFETDEYIEETERLSQQRIWIIVTSIGGVLILSLLYFLRVQKVKNEKLSIEAEHQKANEEVYILTLQQQAKLEEERIKERNRISEELHDGILGKLFGTRFGLGFLPLKGDDTTLEKHQELLNELQDIEKEIRDVSHKLSDNFNSSNINFTSIIKQLLEDKGLIGKFTHSIHFSPEISWKELNEITKANIYRIIQEALQNIIKHAKATHVSLDFSLKNKQLIIKIQDNGVGFDVKKGKKGIGIKNIKSRIEKLKGSLNIESEINIGTTLHINTPYIKKDGN